MRTLATLMLLFGTFGAGSAGHQPAIIAPTRQVMRLPAYLLCLPGEVVERAGAMNPDRGGTN